MLDNVDPMFKEECAGLPAILNRAKKRSRPDGDENVDGEPPKKRLKEAGSIEDASQDLLENSVSFTQDTQDTQDTLLLDSQDDTGLFSNTQDTLPLDSQEIIVPENEPNPDPNPENANDDMQEDIPIYTPILTSNEEKQAIIDKIDSLVEHLVGSKKISQAHKLYCKIYDRICRVRGDKPNPNKCVELLKALEDL